MEGQPYGTANLSALGGVSITSQTAGDMLYVVGSNFVNAQPDTIGLVTKTGAQTISGVKTFTARIALNAQNEIRFYDSDSSNYVAIKAGATIASDITWILPNADGTNGQAIVTNGTGTLSFATIGPAGTPPSNWSGVALLAGRSGGQVLQGGTSNSENLTLESTAGGTKGTVIVAANSPLLLQNRNEIRFQGNTGVNNNYVAFKAPNSISSSVTWTLPATDGTSGQTIVTNGSGTLSWGSSGVTDHGALTGLSDDDHSIYPLLAGRSGGQTLIGGSGSGENLVLGSTSHATKGAVQVQAGTVLELRGSASLQGTVRLFEQSGNGTNYTGMQAAASIASTHTYTLPDALPSASGGPYYLTATSGGVMSWATAIGGTSGTVTVQEVDGSPSLIADTVQFQQSDGFVVSNPVASTARVRLSAVPVSVLATGSANQALKMNSAGTSAEWGVLAVGGGGTGQSSYATGDLLYASTSSALGKLAIGSSRQQLSVVSGLPSWVEAEATEVESWQLEYSSATEILLRTMGDDRIRIGIDGIVYSSGVSVAASNASLGANTLYYVYAYDNSGTLTLEISTTAPSTHRPGAYAYKNAAPSRRYVGKLRTNASSQFTSDGVWSANLRHYATRDLVNDCRLSLSSTLPVSVSDVTAATSVYLHPYVGNRIALWNSNASAWEDLFIDSAQSVAVPSTTNTPFDIFAYSSGGKVLLETTNWTNDTTRATGLTTQNGVLVKSGDVTRRYLGTGRTTGVSGQCEDSATKRFLWNYYHQRPRRMAKVESTANWAYSTNSYRPLNNSTANRVEFVLGFPEVAVHAEVRATNSNDTNGTSARYVGIGVDSTTASTFDVATRAQNGSGSNGDYLTSTAALTTYPVVGYHFLQALEFGAASGTTTWIGASESGIFAWYLG